MKPRLILGLGNPLVGDDGIGWRVAELLAQDPRLPPDTEAICAGTDLLRWSDEMEGRSRVILIDAILVDGRPGEIEKFDDEFSELEHRQWNVHHLSAPQAIGLLQTALPALCKVRFTLLGVTVESLDVRKDLSLTLSERLPEIVDLVLRSLDEMECATSDAEPIDATQLLSTRR